MFTEMLSIGAGHNLERAVPANDVSWNPQFRRSVAQTGKTDEMQDWWCPQVPFNRFYSISMRSWKHELKHHLRKISTSLRRSEMPTDCRPPGRAAVTSLPWNTCSRWSHKILIIVIRIVASATAAGKLWRVESCELSPSRALRAAQGTVSI